MQAREHPAEKVGELRAKAVDLIKYEKLKEYRTHVLSAEFQADTIQLVKDMPAITKSAAMRGADTVKVTAASFKEEMMQLSDKVKAKVPSEVEIKLAAAKVKETTVALLAELKVRLAPAAHGAEAMGEGGRAPGGPATHTCFPLTLPCFGVRVLSRVGRRSSPRAWSR